MIFSGVEIMKALDRAFKYKYHEEFEKGIKARQKKLSKKMNKKSEDIKHFPLIPRNLDRYIVHGAIVRELTKSLPLLNGKLLDVGCGKMPYREFICSNSNTESYIGLDIENALCYDPMIRPDHTWDGQRIPFADAFFDCAIATEVFEHCPNPELVMIEICRVLKPGGQLFFTVPFLWPLHEVPNDEYRYTPFSLNRHLSAAGLVDIDIKPLGGWDASLAQMLGLWIRRRSMGKLARRILSGLLIPWIYFLSQRDNRTTTQFNESTMITGLSGTARKP